MTLARYVGVLDEQARATLQVPYRTTHDADKRSCCQMILFSAPGKSVAREYGYCAAKDWHYPGFKLGLLVARSGMLRAISLK